MAEKIITLFSLIPLYGVLLFGYFYPEESFFFGRRWQFKEEPQMSEAGIKYLKYVSEIGILFLTMMIVILFSENYIIRIISFLVFIFYLIVRVYKLIPK